MKVPQTGYDSYHHHQYQEIFLVWEASDWWRSHSDLNRNNIFFDPVIYEPARECLEYPNEGTLTATS
ncbi:MAG: hypothetical protein RMX68_000475 [Aulosira sp. ZfuVER01]|nr:hypothetical protein [Aulosira sp. ZfuVER01]MDZ7997475.1 hypothetical protein [Aulosira sp. DedVER01a]MDZ8055935.1 hypothetical protein [Aulosira sp. ZfuCHP01]